MVDPMKLLYDEPWMFAIGDFVEHRNGSHYRIVTHAIEEATGTPVYVYSAFGGELCFTTWTRPRSEMEDGRFTRTHAAEVKLTQDGPGRNCSGVKAEDAKDG
jgi:hypothetical protein